MTTTTISYSSYVVLSSFNDITGEWTGASVPSEATVYVGDDQTDTNPADGSLGDGVELDGESLMVSIPAYGWYAPGEYTGWTHNGDPIVRVVTSNTYYIYTSASPDSIPNDGTAAYTPVFTYCFVRGTLIATPQGERAVDSLNIGDLVITAEGNAVPVKWVGRQTRNPQFARINGQMPVLIKADALGDGLPKRDLYVSPDHGMLVDGVLVHALALVNGVSIVQTQDWREKIVMYFHIELENHDLILAEGAPAETFVDNVSRKAFDNYAEYEKLYGDGAAIPELPLPRVKTRRQLSSRARRRLVEIARMRVGEVA